MFQDSALKGQIAFSCSENHWSSPCEEGPPGAQSIIRTCLKRHLGKSTGDRFATTAAVPEGCVCSEEEQSSRSVMQGGPTRAGARRSPEHPFPLAGHLEVRDAGGKPQKGQPPTVLKMLKLDQ